jgi:hypothetical protein
MKSRTTTLIDVISISSHPLKCVVSRTACHTPVIQTVKHHVRLFRKKGTQRCDGHAAINKCVTDSSICIKHIINPIQHRERLVRKLKTEGSVKPNSGIRCMKSGLNGVVRSVNADRSVA